MPQQPIIVNGDFLDWTAEDRAMLSRIHPEDAQAAVDAWKRMAPKKFRALITCGTAGSPIEFNFARMIYVVKATGRAVPASAIKQAVSQAIEGWRKSMQSTTSAMLSGNVELGVWQAQMSQQLKQVHTAGMILGKGGIGQVTREDALWLEGEMRWQNERLQRFAIQVKRGDRAAASELTVNGRVGMYADAGRGTYEAMKKVAHEDAGFDEERRVLGQAEHCPGCVEEAAKGWSPLGSLLEIGDAECIVNCKCHFEYRVSPEAQAERARILQQQQESQGNPSEGRPVSARASARSLLETAVAILGR